MFSVGVPSNPAAILAAYAHKLHCRCIKDLAERAQQTTTAYTLITESITSLLRRQQNLNSSISSNLHLCKERLQAAHVQCQQCRMAMGWPLTKVQRLIRNETDCFETEIGTFLSAAQEEETKLQEWLQEVNQKKTDSLRGIEGRKAEVDGIRLELLEKLEMTLDMGWTEEETKAFKLFLEEDMLRVGKEEEHLKEIQALQEEGEMAKVAHHKKVLCLVELVQGIQHQKAEKEVWMREAKERLYQDYMEREKRIVLNRMKEEEVMAQVKAVEAELVSQLRKLGAEEGKYKKEIAALEEALKADLDRVRGKAQRRYHQWKEAAAGKDFCGWSSPELLIN